MKNMDNYRWIIPSLIALGVILLSGGIFVGVKSYETLEANSTKVDNTTQKNLSSKQIQIRWILPNMASRR